MRVKYQRDLSRRDPCIERVSTYVLHRGDSNETIKIHVVARNVIVKTVKTIFVVLTRLRMYVYVYFAPSSWALPFVPILSHWKVLSSPEQ